MFRAPAIKIPHLSSPYFLLYNGNLQCLAHIQRCFRRLLDKFLSAAKAWAFQGISCLRTPSNVSYQLRRLLPGRLVDLGLQGHGVGGHELSPIIEFLVAAVMLIA